MDKLIEIKEVMDEYVLLLDQMTEFEQKKLDSLKAKDFAQLDEFLKKEQAMFLQLRVLDGKRERLQKEAGLEGKSYREMIASIKPPMQQEFQASFEELSHKTNLLKDLLRTARSHIELQLHTIDNFRERIGNDVPHGQKPQEKEGQPHVFKSVKA